jgi:localization factor PodJL
MVGERLDELTRRIDGLMRRDRQPDALPADTTSSRPAPDIATSLQAIEGRLASMLRELVPQTQASTQRLPEVIEDLTSGLDRLGTVASTSNDIAPRDAAVDRALGTTEENRPKPHDPMAGLSDALAEIAARQRELDAEIAGAQDFSRLEQQLRHITEQIETLRRPAHAADAQDFSRLEQLLQHITGQIETLRGAPQAAGAPDFSRLEQQLRHITEQIETLRRRAHAADTQDFSRLEQQLRHIAEQIETLRRLAHAADAQDFSRLEQQLRHITEQIETLRRPADGPADVETWQAHRTALDRIESKILDLAKKLDAADARLDSLGSIERSIADLMFQLQEIRDRIPLERVESKILELTQKVEASDARLDHVGTIEQSIADLVVQLNETRAAAVEEAERAAKSVAGEILADSGAMSMEIDALKRALSEFRASQAEIDHHTEDALEVVHDTVERLLDRLATLESGVRTAARSSAEAQNARLQSSSRSGPIPAAAPETPSGPKLAPEPWPSDSDLPADHPLEPGSGAPRGRDASSAATRTDASEALTPNPAAAEPAAKANFIAAARRAAQAAAAENADPEGSTGTRSQTAAGIATLARRRRTLMVAAGVLLFGAGSVHVAVNGPTPSLANVKDFVRAHAPLLRSERSLFPPKNAKPAAAPAPSEARAALAPDPVVPESGPPAARPQSSPAGDEFLLSPVPDGSVAPASDPQAQESLRSRTAPPAGTRTGEFTGSTAASPGIAPMPGSGRATRETTPNAADKRPSAIGNSALRSAAAAGNSAAEYEVGIRFSEGRGVPQSFEEAARWLARAADHGLAPAQYRLGSLYEKGQGVKKDLMEARRLYLAAAQQGNAKAMHNLAVLYAVGLDGGPEYKTASEWFQKAAEHGLADSQYNLAILYARGVGVEQNLAESYKWFALAAQQGDQDAAKKRDEIAARLEAESLVAARLAVQTWTADPQPDKATKVEPPGGDWDQALPISPSAKSKPARRTGAPGSV